MTCCASTDTAAVKGTVPPPSSPLPPCCTSLPVPTLLKKMFWSHSPRDSRLQHIHTAKVTSQSCLLKMLPHPGAHRRHQAPLKVLPGIVRLV